MSSQCAGRIDFSFSGPCWSRRHWRWWGHWSWCGGGHRCRRHGPRCWGRHGSWSGHGRRGHWRGGWNWRHGPWCGRRRRRSWHGGGFRSGCWRGGAWTIRTSIRFSITVSISVGAGIGHTITISISRLPSSITSGAASSWLRFLSPS
ncbi:MAG: hypothetical protein B7Z55_09600 [Planctomycetales bacterium 12-60-4]|nr:MAG: hypothetical protein B7Z55_09600 [Planctomycetales bacterium 12-60-4]